MASVFGTAVTKGVMAKATMAMTRAVTCMLVIVLCAR